jgi:hypothetical protein
MAVSLRKEILPGTWRYLGLIHGPVDVGKIPVGERVRWPSERSLVAVAIQQVRRGWRMRL